MKQVDFEVVVAGAGPAGVATAVAAIGADPSLRGRVLVIDRARFPRAKPCGGGLTGHVDEALAALGLSLSVPSFASPRALVRYGAIEREVTLPRPVRTVRREAFDHSLVEQARARGIEVREGTSLTGYAVRDGQVELESTAGRLRARVLVGADGAGSLVRKGLDGEATARARRDGSPSEAGTTGDAADRGTRARPIRLFRAELPDRGWQRDAMLYDFTPMRDGLRGYLWIFPAPGGLLNVGLMHDPSVSLSGAELAALLRARLLELGIALDGAALRGWPAWGYRPGRRVAAPHVLTVGDAAGIDGLTGEGIAVSLEQGLLAGRAVASALASGDLRFAGYRRALRLAAVGRDLALDRWLARLLYGGRTGRRAGRLWLSLVLLDEDVLELYAARVSGQLVLADRKRALFKALLRHLRHAPSRARSLADAEREPAPPVDAARR